MALRDLPAELKLAIAEQLDPRSCVRFALTCAEHSRLYSSLVASHKKYWECYKTINTDGSGRFIWNITREAIENPKIAQYIEDVSLPAGQETTTWNPSLVTNLPMVFSPAQVPEDIVQVYVSAAMKMPIMQDVLKSCNFDPHNYGPNWNMEQTIRIGYDGPLVALLVSLAINLRILRFTEFRESNEFYDLLQRAASAYADPTKTQSLPFQSLTYVAVAYSGDFGCCNAHWMDLFLSIPSLRGFATYKMGGLLSLQQHDKAQKSFAKSKVKDLLLRYSLFAPETLEKCLSRIEALRSFAYENGRGFISREGCFAPRRVTAALLKYASHSLEQLALTEDGDGREHAEIDCVSLQGFERLRTLRCSWKTITGQQQEDSQLDCLEDHFLTPESYSKESPLDITVRLPRSLEILHLENTPEDDAAWQGLIKMVRQSNVSLP